MPVSILMAFLWAPPAALLGDSSRIMYFHVPIAMVSFLAFVVSGVLSILHLAGKKGGKVRHRDEQAYHSAAIGFAFTVMTVITGSIWAKISWGTFWNWDPRETSIFVLLLIYGAYFALRSALETDEKRATLSAVYSIIAGITVPFFIFVMPRIMSGLHPGAKGDPDGSGPVVQFKMSPNMLVIFLLGLLGFTLLYVWLLNLKVRLAKLEFERSSHQS